MSGKGADDTECTECGASVCRLFGFYAWGFPMPIFGMVGSQGCVRYRRKLVVRTKARCHKKPSTTPRAATIMMTKRRKCIYDQYQVAM
ncbi:hypothetical protein LZ31DRAFT_384490 [Colletotrichum somersetense]|nr:hypothetical protein LZ31DRAFT_384490 [Colletotrichum somersetense]